MWGKNLYIKVKMFVLIFFLDTSLTHPPPPSSLYPPITLDVRENVWVEMLFIILSIMFGSIIVFLVYYRIRKSIFSNNIKNAINKNEDSRLKPNIKNINRPKIGVVVTK